MRIHTALPLATLFLASQCFAQARTDTEFVGASVVLKECPITQAAKVLGDSELGASESALAIAGGTFLAGLAGDLVTAGLNSLGAALEEASREKGFSVVASTSFPYYAIDSQMVGRDHHVTVATKLKDAVSLCLVLSYAGSAPERNRSRAAKADKALSADELSRGSKAWKDNRMPAAPSFYLEAMLQKRADGFVVRPTFLWYANALPGAPNKALPAEIHVAFATPSAPSGEAAATFALTRIRLPTIAPGTVMRADELLRSTSPVLPARPTSGSPDAVKSAYSTALSDLASNGREIESLERLLARARSAAADPEATKEDKAKVHTLEDQLLAAKDKTAMLRHIRMQATTVTPPLEVGSTNVSVRFTVVRSANQFGLAIAKSLQARGKTLGEAVTTHLTPQAPSPVWTSQDTTYIAAMNAVLSAQRSLDTAIAAGDADAIFNAQIALRNAKAAANGAAAGSNRPVPYPGLDAF